MYAKSPNFHFRALDPYLLVTHASSLYLCPYAVDAPNMPGLVNNTISLYPSDIVLGSKSCQTWWAAMTTYLSAKISKSKNNDRRHRASIMAFISQNDMFSRVFCGSCVYWDTLASPNYHSIHQERNSRLTSPFCSSYFSL